VRARDLHGPRFRLATTTSHPERALNNKGGPLFQIWLFVLGGCMAISQKQGKQAQTRGCGTKWAA
jgi:hypothetical protein